MSEWTAMAPATEQKFRSYLTGHIHAEKQFASRLRSIAPAPKLTATAGMAQLLETFPNADRIPGYVRIPWANMVVIVGAEPTIYDNDYEMGDECLTVDIFPEESWDETSERTDYVHVCLAPAIAANGLIESITDDTPEGVDHAEWAMQFAKDQYAAEELSMA